MMRDWYYRPLFILFIFYIFIIIVLTPFLLNDTKPSNNICGYVVSYPYKYYKRYNFYLKSKSSYYLVKSQTGDFSLYDYICLEGEVKKIKNPKSSIVFNWEEYMKYKNVFYETEIKKITYLKKTNFILRLVHSIRKNIKEIMKKRFFGDDFSIITGVFLGEKEEMSLKLKNAVIDCGAAHLLVASGSNVAYIVGMVALFFSFAGFSGKLFRFVSAIFVSSYLLLVGFDPPITRAFLMFIFGFLIYNLKQNIDMFQILILSAFLMIILKPLIVYDKGFQLSFLSVYGIITGYKLYGRYLNVKKISFLYGFKIHDKAVNGLNKIISMVLITFFAQVAISPVLINTFYKISIVSLVSNIFLIPISFLIMVFVTLLFGLNKIGFIADIIYAVLKLFTGLFIKLSLWFSSTDFSVFYFSFPNEVNFIFSLVLIFIILNMPIINIKSSIVRSLLFFIMIGYITSFWGKEKKTGVIEFENFGIKGYIILNDDGVYIINPVISADKIIAAVYSSGFNSVESILVSSMAGFKEKEIDRIKKVFNVKKIYTPLWKCREGFLCVYGNERIEIFDVKFKNNYGYFDHKTRLAYCYKDRCY